MQEAGPTLKIDILDTNCYKSSTQHIAWEQLDGQDDLMERTNFWFINNVRNPYLIKAFKEATYKSESKQFGPAYNRFLIRR